MRRARRLGGWAVGAAIVALAAASVARSVALDEPPRFDGAVYAGLARSLAEGRGYRDPGHPDAPPHSHFPPAYPAALALIWTPAGPSSASAHAFSVVCTLVAVGSAWAWLRGRYPASTAAPLAAALAINWAWARIGGAIQSEPLFLALTGFALLAEARAARTGRAADGARLGLILAACLLTRHVGACLAIGLGLDLLSKRKWRALAGSTATAALVVAPWVVRIARSGRGTQADLFAADDRANLIARMILFYLRRIPDQVAGPFVEVATVFGRSPRIGLAATLLACAATGLIAVGWAGAIRNPRRRAAGLVPLATFPLLLAWPFTEAGRFLIPLLPMILVGAVEGLSIVLRRLGFGGGSRRTAARLVLAASIPYAAYAAVTDRAGAQRRSHDGLDAACRWIARDAPRPGPVLARLAADAHWLTGRPAIAPGPDPAAIDRLIERYDVAYLLVDPGRYADAPDDPIARYILARPARSRQVWGGDGSASVHEVIGPAPGPRR